MSDFVTLATLGFLAAMLLLNGRLFYGHRRQLLRALSGAPVERQPPRPPAMIYVVCAEERPRPAAIPDRLAA